MTNRTLSCTLYGQNGAYLATTLLLAVVYSPFYSKQLEQVSPNFLVKEGLNS